MNSFTSKSSKQLPVIIGQGYKQFWEFTGRYRVIKGGRGSKKSTTASLWFPYNMMKFWHKYGIKPNVLVMRRFYNTHRDSTFAQLKWAINRLGVTHLWKANKSPFELTYIPSGQKIMFRGLDDPESITSVTVEDGYLCWVWWEEAFQITNEEDFNKIDLSIRGEVPFPLFKQHTFVFNPWSDKIWLKRRFFDKVGKDGVSTDGDILAITRNYDCNEFLGLDDIRIFDKMKEDNPRRYSIEGEGNWGIAQGLVYTNWEEQDFRIGDMKRQVDVNGIPKYRQLHGLDFGYTNDPTAFVAFLADETNKRIYIYDEIYRTYMKNRDIYEAIRYKGHEHSRIAADSEDPRTIAELKDMGLTRIFGVKKGRGSVNAGIQLLQDYKIYVHPSCVNTIVELSNYVWASDKNTGEPTNEPSGEYNHLMDALRYGAFSLGRQAFSW